MNRSAGAVLAFFTVVSFLAGSGSRARTTWEPEGSAVPSTSSSGLIARKSSDPKKSNLRTNQQDSQWSVPPDPRCFLIDAIRDFYGSENPAVSASLIASPISIASGPYYKAYRFAQYGCSPGKIDESAALNSAAATKTWGIPGKVASGNAAPPIPPIRFVIVTAPDPVRSHLSLFFDRSMDAVQEGAQAAGYLFSIATMPWDFEQQQASSDLNTSLAWQRYQSDKEKLPGLIIFRKIDVQHTPPKPEEDLFVFVVGETPTGGIHKDQFTNALSIIGDIRKVPGVGLVSKNTLPIMGPTFSGSLPSLNDLLVRNKGRLCANAANCSAYVHSGTVTSYAWASWFLSVQSHVDFTTFQESDDYAECHFFSYVVNQHYKLSEIAEISEDETAFGDTGSEPPASDKCALPGLGDILRLHFPREISQLRSAYQSELGPTPQLETGGQPPRVTLPLNLEDSGSDEDTVRTYAHRQYPLSQESVMLTLATILRAHHSRYVLLKASDPVDLLFLTRFLRQAYPQGRIVTIGADLLFRHEVEDDLLHGIMAITSYSLLPRADDAMPRPCCTNIAAHFDPLFPSSYSSGVYNATLSVLSLPEYPGRACEADAVCEATKLPQLNAAPYTEYGWPRIVAAKPASKCFLSPALWLTVLGRDSYWPVALLDTYSFNPEIKSRLRSVAENDGKNIAPPYYEPSIPQSWIVLSAAALALALYYLFLMRNGSVFASSEALSMFAPAGRGRRTRLIAFTVFTLMTGLDVVWAPWVWLASVDDEPRALFFAFLLAVIWVALCLSFSMQIKRRGASEITMLFLLSTVLLCCLLMAAGYWLSRDPATFNPALFRYVHATSGVSVMPPLLLLIAAALWWSWHVMEGVALFDCRRPVLPSESDLIDGTSFCNRLSQNGTKRLCQLLFPLPPGCAYYAAAYVVAIVAFFSFFWSNNRHHPVWTLEPWPFDWVYALALLTVALAMAFELARLVLVWLELRKVLRALDGLLLRRTFSYIKGFPWQRLWSLGGGSSHDANRALNREMDAWKYVVRESGDLFTRGDFSEEALRIKTTIDGFRGVLESVYQDKSGSLAKDVKTNRQVLSRLVRLRKELATCCAVIFNSLLETWKHEPGPDLYDTAGENKVHTPEHVPAKVRIYEQFVALVYVNFVVTVLLRMRTVIMIVAGLYVFLLLSLSVYPVEPKPILRPLLILMFFAVVATVGWVYAQMHRDSILSKLTDTTPGELGTDFYLKMASFVLLPLLSLLVSQFPDLNNFLFSWLHPAMQALSH